MTLLSLVLILLALVTFVARGPAPRSVDPARARTAIAILKGGADPSSTTPLRAANET